MIKYSHYLFKINCSAITTVMGSVIQHLKPSSLRTENKKLLIYLDESDFSVRNSLFSLPALNTGNVKMQNFRMRLSRACFLFGRRLMKGTAGWKDGRKEDFESIQCSSAFFKISLSDFLHLLP